MTIDKIKFYMCPSIFNFWTSLHKVITVEECTERMLKAKEQLENEVEKGIRENTIEVQAEINLLKHLTQ
jgi:hypothetical protein